MFLLSRTSGAFKSAQVNCIIITSSMCPIQLFQTRFQLYCRQQHFNSFDKEEHLKGNRVWNVFLVHFSMDPDSQSPVWCSETTLKNVWRSLRLRFRAIWAAQICKVSPLGTNHGGTLWVTKLMESMNKWPTTLSKFISTTASGMLSTSFPKFTELHYPAGIWLFKVNNGNTSTMCEICSKSTIKTL